MIKGYKSYFGDARTSERVVGTVTGFALGAFVTAFGVAVIDPVVGGLIPERYVAEIYVGNATINLITLLEASLTLLFAIVLIYPIFIRPLLKRRQLKQQKSESSQEPRTNQILTEILDLLRREELAEDSKQGNVLPK